MNHQKTSQCSARLSITKKKKRERLSHQVFCFIPLSRVAFCDYDFIFTLFMWLWLLLPLLQTINEKKILEVRNIPCNEISEKLMRQEIGWEGTSSIFWVLRLETSDCYPIRSSSGWLFDCCYSISSRQHDPSAILSGQW